MLRGILLRLIIIFGLAFASLSFADDAIQVNTRETQLRYTQSPAPGWIETEDPAISRNAGAVCRGSFTWQGQEYPDDQLTLEAAEISQEEGILIMSGGVKAFFASLQIESQEAIYYQDTQELMMSGNVYLSSPQILANAARINYSITTNVSDTDDLTELSPRERRKQIRERKRRQRLERNRQFLRSEDVRDIPGQLEIFEGVYSLPQTQAHGYAANIQYSEELLVMEETKISFCDPNEESWHIRSKNLSLDLDASSGTARAARFYLEATPVMYLPYAYFPLRDKRKTGLLLPNFNYNGFEGLSYEQPIYFNLAPNYDSTMYLTAVQNRGLIWEQDFRWLASGGSGRLGFGFVTWDAVKREPRYALNFDFDSIVDRGWSGEIKWLSAGDREYFNDVSSIFSPSSSFSLERRAEVRFANKIVDLTFGVLDYQEVGFARTDDQLPYRNLPYTILSLNGALGSGFYLDNTFRYQQFSPLSTPQEIDPNNLINNPNAQNNLAGQSSRVFNEAILGWQGFSRFAKGQTNLVWQGLYYAAMPSSLASFRPIAITDRSAQLTQSRLSYDFDASLRFSRSFSNTPISQTREGTQSTRRTRACPCHLLVEPRIYLLASDISSNTATFDFLEQFSFDTSARLVDYDYLFSPYRFNGIDRGVEEGRISIGLETRVISMDGANEFRFRIGQLLAQDFAASADSVPFDKNIRAMDLTYSFKNSHFGIDLGGGGERYIDFVGASLIYRDAKKSGISLLYRYQEDTSYQESVNQLASDFVWHLYPRWSLFGGLRYDFSGNILNNIISGFGYENCCFSTRLGVYARNVTTRNRQEIGAAVQFAFTPFGEIAHTGASAFGTIPGGRLSNLYGEFR